MKILALDADAAICANCVRALGGKPIDKLTTVSPMVCGRCKRIEPCAAVRDFVWPLDLICPDPRPEQFFRVASRSHPNSTKD